MRNTLLLVVLATAVGCSNDSSGTDRSDAALSPPDLRVAGDFAVAPDLTGVIDMGDTSDMTPEVDMVEVGPCGMHDPTNASCDDLSNWINDWLACHTVCSNDSDCVLVSVHNIANCRNPCDVVASSQTDGAYLQSLNDEFVGSACGSLGCACLNPGTPTCVNGKCIGM